MTKVLYLKSIVEGISFRSRTEGRLNPIIDPTVVASHSRSIFETTGMFNLIYRSAETPDEKIILYNLWVHAGLAYRQRFTDVIQTSENRKKADDEQQLMADLVQDIQATTLFNHLDDRQKKKIKLMLEQKNYLIKFEPANNVRLLHWHDLIGMRHIKPGYLDHLYTYYSLYAHPSNVAVFQFAELFQPGNEQYEQLTIFSLKNVFVLISIFINDYIKVFPRVLDTFNSLPLFEQIVIDFHNRYMRGYEFAINDSWKELG